MSDKEKDVEQTNAAAEGIVFYTDGGCRPTNPGNIGWGFHGYRFSVQPPKKGSGNQTHVLTTTGYAPKGEKPADVTPLEYYDAFGSYADLATNNVAEVMAARHAVDKALEYNVKTVLIKTDSKYVQNGIMDWSHGWVRNNWIRQDGSQVPNMEHWKPLTDGISRLKDKGATIDVEWVRSHVGNLGNEAADKLATVGVMNSKARHYLTNINSSKPDGYWKLEVEKHPFFFNKRVYFNTLLSSQISGEYQMGDHGKDDELLGDRNADGAYSILQLKTPEPILEMVRKYQTDMSGDLDTIVMIRLDRLFSPAVYKDVENYGRAAVVQPNPNKLDLTTHDGEPLTLELRPPRLAMRAIDALSSLKSLLTKYRSGTSQEISVTDITDLFYEEVVSTDKKGKVTTEKKLKPSFVVGIPSVSTEVNALSENGVIKVAITLTMGIDIADRNSLKRAETLNPKIVAITWCEAPDVYRYATITEADGDYCISCGVYSNLIFRQP